MQVKGVWHGEQGIDGGNGNTSKGGFELLTDS
jgi:hypothetical protein